MEFAEALLTLGVGGASEWETLSTEALKRAYLKKVRAHPPERDPQGFQRVREAYELLHALGPTRAAVRLALPLVPKKATSAESVMPTPMRKRDETERVASGQKSESGSAALTRLQQALSEKQYDTAADALLEIYASEPPVRPHPPPHLALSVVTKQFMRGSQDSGRRLFVAFEADMARTNTPLNERVAAIWKLLAELIALSAEAPPTLVCVLASGIESGDFREATEALRIETEERRLESRVGLESLLQRAAPTLYRAAWPTNQGLSRKLQRTVETWALRMLFAMILFACYFMDVIVERAKSQRASQSQPAAASTPDVARSSELASTARDGAANRGALSTEQAKDLAMVTNKLEKVLRFSRCEQLRATWQEYASVAQRLKGYESVMPQFEEHRALATATCRPLESELSEIP